MKFLSIALLLLITSITNPAFSDVRSYYGCFGEDEFEVCEPAEDYVEYDTLFIEVNDDDINDAIVTLTVAAIRGCAMSPACVALVGTGLRKAYGVAKIAAGGAAGSALWDGIKVVWSRRTLTPCRPCARRQPTGPGPRPVGGG